MTSQTAALTPAQAQPSASSSPNIARLRGTIPPGPELLGHAAGAHEAVSVPVMFGWTEQTNG